MGALPLMLLEGANGKPQEDEPHIESNEEWQQPLGCAVVDQRKVV